MKELREQSGQDQAVNALRRKLLKASAAAPLLATLAPNAALAMSSATQCVENGDFSQLANAPVGSGDNAVRVMVPFYSSIGNPPGGLPSGLYLIDGDLYGADGVVYTPQGETLTTRYNPPVNVEVLELFSVVNGQPMSVGVWPKVQLDSNVTPLSGSCWSSLAANDVISYT